MTEAELVAIEVKTAAVLQGEPFHYILARFDVPALVAEVRRLRTLVTNDTETFQLMAYPSAAAARTSDNTRWGV